MKSESNINIILTNEYFESGFQKLKDSGLNTFHFPMIKTKSVINEIKINLDLIDCIIFVSKNGVRYFFENENTKKYDLSNKYFVCIGKKTANKLIKMGYKPGYICGKNYSMEMSKELKINKVLDSKKSLLVQGTLSNPMFYNSLSKFSTVKKEVFYQTIKTKKESKEIKMLSQKNKPYVVFSSPSAFEAFSCLYNPKDFHIISIGRTTSAAIEKNGFRPELTSKMQTYEGISESLLKFLKNYNYEIS